MSRSESSLLHEAFEQQAHRTPERIALRDQQRTITYAQLRAQAAGIAHALRARGIQPGSFVGVRCDRSLEWVSTTLAILQTGAAVVPLPPSYPTNRLRQILAQVSLHAVIDDTTSPLDESLSANVWRTQDLRTEGDAGGGHSTEGNPDAPAFVLCSSGTTGQPKLIVRSHRSFFHRLRWTWTQHPYGPDEVCCQKSQMTTTHAIYELFEPLLRGTPQVVIADGDVRNLEIFWETLRRSKVSRLLIVPSALRASLDMQAFVAPDLEVMVLMGEYVDAGLAERAVATLPARTRLYTVYGSTEASSALVCDISSVLRPGQELPLGQPISPDVHSYVLGPDLRAVAPGEAGRLYLGGPLLFSGYLGDQELTRSALVRSTVSDELLYDTKDDVRLMPDASLEFVGRADDTVKVRGFRVNTREVENALRVIPGVTSAATVATDGGPFGVALCAFVTPATVETSRVRHALHDQLPDYMVPSVIVAMEALPLTSSGKVDRLKLLEQRRAAVPAASHRTASEMEARIGRIWSRLLQHEDFSLDSSFFEVGGTSLSVLALVQRVRNEFGFTADQFTEQSVLRFPSVEALAAHVESLQHGHTPPEVQKTPLLVRLRRGGNEHQEPFFLISSAGGTLGAYAKLTQALRTSREIVGVRDPFVWGERDPKEDFQTWVVHYLRAIRERQPEGPYYIGAYSSAGAFGYELARLLRQDGQRVALLALIDPLALQNQDRSRYGYWVFRARNMRPPLRTLVLLAGRCRGPLRGVWNVLRPKRPPFAQAMSETEFRQLAEGARQSEGHIRTLASLFEINTGLPFTLDETDLAGAGPHEYLGILQRKVATLTPDVEPATIESIAIQYVLQLRAQNSYELPVYDGDVVLVEPDGPHAGLVPAQLRPMVRRLQTRTARIGEPSDRVRAVSSVFMGFADHYRTMRDDVFVRDLADCLEPFLA